MDFDEFAQPSAQQAKTPVVESVPKQDTLFLLVGDLPEAVRKHRALQERVWTRDKGHVEEFYLSGFSGAARETTSFLPIGTNSMSCYALRSSAPDRLRAYFDAHAMLEARSVKAALDWRIAHVKLRGHAKLLRSYVQSIEQREPALQSVTSDAIKRLDALIPTLPELLDPLPPPPTPADRPGEATPEVVLFDIDAAAGGGDIKPSCSPINAAGGGVDSFSFWTCNTTDAKQRWTEARTAPLHVKQGTIPCMAVNETHAVVAWQPPVGDFEMRLYALTPFGRMPRTHLRQWTARFMGLKEFRAGEGALHLALSEDGVTTLACGNVVFVTTRSVVTKTEGEALDRILALCVESKRHTRCITCARIQGQLLVLATSYGECYEVHWHSSDDDKLVESFEQVLACEPIYAAYSSNRRLVLQTALAISGRLTPYHTTDFVYLPSGRVLASALCGALLFVLDKYGALLLYLTVKRDEISPFSEPPDHLWQPTPGVIAYPALHASAERVVALYPNGLIRVLRIKDKIARQIVFRGK